MPTTKRMGRPPKQEQTMDKRLIVLLTADEHERLMQIVNERGQSISVVVRRAIEKAYPQVFKEK